MTSKNSVFAYILLILACLVTNISLADTTHIGRLPIQTWTTAQ